MSMLQKFLQARSSGELTLLAILAGIFIFTAGANIGSALAAIFSRT